MYYTTNIDIQAETQISLKDIVQIDDGFISALKEGKLQSPITEAQELLDNLTDDEWLQMLIKADSSSSGTYSYLTKDAIGIIVEVPHAIGDHAELEVSLQNVDSKLE
ncbi:hypothetical protein ABEW34_11915 [Paenibacillus algorifonticola]|uniref:hypothetical protein n=1 Tax=Paenibacillus algorifonticola TaxID=684063 RepID=UPI003D27C471